MNGSLGRQPNGRNLAKRTGGAYVELMLLRRALSTEWGQRRQEASATDRARIRRFTPGRGSTPVKKLTGNAVSEESRKSG